MNEEKIVVTYDYYTIDQAREIVYRELRHKRAVRKWKAAQEAEERKRKRLALLYQKCAGLYMIAMCLGFIFVEPAFATFSVIGIPFGLYVMTRKEILL